jgi:hypothetical protein
MERGQYSRKVEAHGETVWRLLEQNPGGLTLADLMELSELTRAQVRKAFEYIRDLFADAQDQPIIFIPGRHHNIYKLAVVPLESDDDLRRRLNTWRVQIRRARTAIAQPSASRWPDAAPLFRRLGRHMAVVEEDLADLLNGLG